MTNVSTSNEPTRNHPDASGVGLIEAARLVTSATTGNGYPVSLPAVPVPQCLLTPAVGDGNLHCMTLRQLISLVPMLMGVSELQAATRSSTVGTSGREVRHISSPILHRKAT